VSRLSTLVLLALVAVRERTPAGRPRDDGDRGDVPGWVMIVVMTAALVAALLAVVAPRLTDVFDRAVDAVSR
jgi:hypothetical protein